MPKTTRLTGPSKADGTQTAPLEQRATDLEFTGPQADVTVGGRLIVAGDVTIGGEPLTLLVAGDPAELDFATVGGETTATLTDLIARNAMSHGSGQYYFSHGGTASAGALNQDQLVLCPVWLSDGTIDRLGIDVAVAVAATTVRLGVYTDNGGLPDALIAETTAAASSATTGIKDQTIAAAIPINGRYWLAGVGQGGTGVSINAANSVANNPLPIPIGTAAPGGTTNYMSRTVAGVSGALPATITGLGATAAGTRFRWHFRYA